MGTPGVTTDWKDVRCASLRTEDLRVLAGLRGRAEIRVLIVDDRAWVCWQGDEEVTADILPGRILPLEGVELYAERGGLWYRLGGHLPALDVPFRTGEDGVALDRLMIPGKLSAQRPSGQFADPLQVGLARDERDGVRPATAMRCSLEAIFLWAEQATSLQFSALRGAWRQGGAGDEGQAEVFVIGEPARVPHLNESVRYWGTELLVPLGFRADPELPAGAIRGAVGAGEGDLVVIDMRGIELIERDAFEPLSRAGIRLAHGEFPGTGSSGGRAR